MTAGRIELRGVAVHNLRHVDVDIPRQRLVVLCGVSGSGKTSLALDTLYAEGQRRYIESFSVYTRQFLERLEKPQADRIDGLPPAIAFTHSQATRGSRATVASVTETYDYLRLLMAKIGRVFCPDCQLEVRRHTPESAAETLAALPAGTRYLIGYALRQGENESLAEALAALKEDGLLRVVLDDRMIHLGETSLDAVAASSNAATSNGQAPLVVIDRLVAESAPSARLRDSLELAFAKGDGACHVWVADGEQASSNQNAGANESAGTNGHARRTVDGRAYRTLAFSNRLACGGCGREFPVPEPRLFSFNSPLGACPTCEGFGNVIDADLDLIVPDANKSIREGAIAPWNTPAYAHELEELLALADDYNLPVDVPFRELSPEQIQLIREGAPERNFGGLNGFFAWLEKRKYKMHLRVFLSRWRSYRVCPDCRGARLRPDALAVRLGGEGAVARLNIAQMAALQAREARDYFTALENSLSSRDRQAARVMLEQVRHRIDFLCRVGLGYMTLDRTLRTLSGGEAQRVALTAALGSSLTNMLYVLDEPSVGLHPQDVAQLLTAIEALRDRGNSVVVVEHEEEIIRAADWVIEIGPGAGSTGGRVTFAGAPAQLIEPDASLTGEYLAGRRGIHGAQSRRQPNHGWIRITGARGNNLQNVSCEFPLGVLCLVTGVSGAGKSTLVQDTLYPALCRRKRKDAPKPEPYDDVFGDGQFDDIVLVDQSPIGRSPRSNPVTYVKAFDEIRNVFADTVEARTHNYTSTHFSFNVDGGRCAACEGDGYVRIDMQFMADVFMKCSQCQGRRYRREILEVAYRGKNIADVLDMTVREAFHFFRGQNKVQTRLKRLIDVGLDYLRLGQPANTLSAGEAQRLKLAAYLSASRRGRTLFILDEPTVGLHPSDIVQLLDCFDALLSVGHSLIVVEHNRQMMQAADYLIDLGPGAAERGGAVVAQGTPEMVARCENSATGQLLAQMLELDQTAAASG